MKRIVCFFMVLIYYGTNGQSLVTFNNFKFGIKAANFSPNGKIIVGSNSHYRNSDTFESSVGLAFWDLLSGKEYPIIWRNARSFYSIGISSDSKKIVAGGFDGLLVLYNIETDSLKYLSQTESVHEDDIISIDFDKSNDFFVTCSKESIALWDSKLGKLIRKYSLIPLEGSFNKIDISPDGKKIVVCDDSKIIRIIDTISGLIIVSLFEFVVAS